MARDKKDITVITKDSKKTGTGIRKKIKHPILKFCVPALAIVCIAIFICTEKPKWQAEDKVPSSILIVDEDKQEYVNDSEASRIESSTGSSTVVGEKEPEEETTEEDPNRNYDTSNPTQKPPVR